MLSLGVRKLQVTGLILVEDGRRSMELEALPLGVYRKYRVLNRLRESSDAVAAMGNHGVAHAALPR